MQIDQLFELVYILIDKKQVKAKEMAEHFGVSTRTIYRWLDALSVSGVPVYSTKGRSGGIAISENYTLDKTILSDEEKLAVLSSVKAFNKLSGNSLPSNPNLKAAEKLSRLVKDDSDWIEVDFSPWSPEGHNLREVFGTLRDSILKKHQITFDYFSSGGITEKRTVHPWKLVYRGQAWYLQGWCISRKAERFFKLSRMINVQKTGRAATVTKENAGAPQDDKHKNPAEDKMNISSKNKIKMPTEVKIKTQPLIKIKSKVSSRMAFYLLDTFACSEIHKHRDGSITAVFSAPDEPWLPGMLLSFGGDLKIISPEKIQKEVMKMARDVIRSNR